MKRVALFTDYGWIGISSPLINTALYLNDLGFSIDIYIKESDFCNELGLGKPHLNNRKTINFKYYKLSQVSKNNVLAKNLDEIEAYLLEKPNYEFLIGFDPYGLIKAGLFGQLLNIKFIYFSLEIYEVQDEIKKLECFFSHLSVLCITQDLQRMNIIANLNNISLDKLTYVWNSSYENTTINEKQNYFRERFNIPIEKKIILATGTLLDITGIDVLLEAFLNFKKDNFVLVLHGWIPNKSFEKYILSKIDNKKIFLSNDLIPFEEKYSIFSSCDFGFIFYQPIDLNLKYAAGSSGKLFDFMRCGVPMLGNDIPKMKEYLEENKIGRIFYNTQEIEMILNEMDENYEYYSQNAKKIYGNYSFQKSLANALKEYV